MNQRAIKFRAWDKVNSQMCIVIGFNFLQNTAEVVEKVGDTHGNILHFIPRKNDEVGFGYLMQFTGLKDKNGKEIYEGDIVRILYTDWGSQVPNEKGVYELSLEEYKKSISDIGFVEWVRDRWMLKFSKNRFGEHTWDSLQEGNHGEKEIIGNIYENKELLVG